jgi:hypothetical protein
MSSTAYIELMGPGDKMLARRKICLSGDKGLGWIRIPDNIMSGYYYLRTYTSWMKNLHPSGYAYSLISVINPFLPLYFVHHRAGGDNKVERGAAFFPERACHIYGVENRLFFRLSGMRAIRDSITAAVKDAADSMVARPCFINDEYGYFIYTPKQHNEYYLSLITTGIPEIKVPVPRAENGGYTLDWTENPDFLILTIQHYPSSGVENQQLLLRAALAGRVFFSGTARLENRAAELLIPAEDLGAGIHEFTLTDPMGNHLCRRIMFRPPRDRLSVRISPEDGHICCRDSVLISVRVRDTAGRPVKSNLCASVYLADPAAISGSLPEKKMAEALSAGYLLHDVRNPGKGNSYREPSYFPELAGPAVSGRVLERKTGRPAANRLVICSALGSASRFQVFTTGEDGRFRFAITGSMKHKDLVFRVPDQGTILDIEIDDPYSEQYLPVLLPAFAMEKSSARYIEQLSVNKQVQEAYRSTGIKPATEGNAAEVSCFYGGTSETVNLEQYIRLPVMEEIFREIVKSVIIYRKSGAYKIGVIDDDTREIIGENPLFLLDGVPLFDHGKILGMDPAFLSTIHVVGSKYFMGDLEMDGIIDIRSRQGEAGDFDLPPSTRIYQFRPSIGLESVPGGAGRTTEKGQGEHLPDFRTLLYWNPVIPTDAAGHAEISVKTGDIPGIYRVVVKGISKDGSSGQSTTVLEIGAED